MDNKISLRQRTSTAFAVAVAALLALMTAGCGRHPDRVVGSGNVTYAGQPVQQEKIRFVPVGKLRVEIRAYDMTGVVIGPGAPPPKQLIPLKYNERSELTVTIDDSAGRQLTHNFDFAR